uniref:Exocyst subunit Exo70 family protein n=1 Tax=Ananas comosus var. bracteatus TaxID=296719 RepID=A0A6V7Q721_ANACO|nr:unnamed protein product [Ananas comosus var. bracteatus]
MNNIHYMVRSVRRSEAKDLLGDDWIQRHRRIVQQNANQYRRVAWASVFSDVHKELTNFSLISLLSHVDLHVLQSLSGQGLTSSGGSGPPGSDGGNSSGASRAAVKREFRSFNVQFEELHQRQCQWTVPDQELRESLRLAVAEILLPAYRSFIKRFGKNPQKYVKYSPEDLERMLGEFFEGKPMSDGSSSRGSR